MIVGVQESWGIGLTCEWRIRERANLQKFASTQALAMAVDVISMT
jgi:hypothetical protein